MEGGLRNETFLAAKPERSPAAVLKVTLTPAPVPKAGDTRPRACYRRGNVPPSSARRCNLGSYTAT
jgi:hypothetical protein